MTTKGVAQTGVPTDTFLNLFNKKNVRRPFGARGVGSAQGDEQGCHYHNHYAIFHATTTELNGRCCRL